MFLKKYDHWPDMLYVGDLTGDPQHVDKSKGCTVLWQNKHYLGTAKYQV